MKILPSKWRPIHVIWLCLLIFAVGALLGWQAYEFFAIDTCLDRGGAWAGWFCRFR